MELRGQVHVEIFGPETLAEIDAGIVSAASELGLEVESFQSNVEAQVLARIANQDFAAMIINPSGFTESGAQIAQAIQASGVPTYEVHASNPAVRGVQSVFAPVCVGSICGLGYSGYSVALQAISLRRDISA